MPPRRAKRKARVIQQEERIPTPDLQIKLQRTVDFSTLCSVSAPMVKPQYAGICFSALMTHWRKSPRNSEFAGLSQVDHVRLRAGAFAHAIALHPQLATAVFVSA